jgi:Skp family chaperone for outer membrane proteins
MRKLFRHLMIAGLLAVVASPAMAQTPAPAPRSAPAAAPPSTGPVPAPAIAVVDMAQIQEQASVMKSIREQMQKEEAGFRADLTKRENDLRAADQDLQQQRTLLSADAFNERRRNFEQQAGESQRFMAARKRQLDAAFADGMRQVDVAMNGVLKEIAKERGLNLILPKQGAMLADGSLDITEDVKRRLDGRLKTVAIKLPPLQK